VHDFLLEPEHFSVPEQGDQQQEIEAKPPPKEVGSALLL
jgi:hypothetical protein